MASLPFMPEFPTRGGVNNWVSIYNEPSIGNRKDILQTVDVPNGVDVLLVSWTEVESAYVL